jgi:hypothetical protein
LGKHFNGEFTVEDLLTLDITLKIGSIKCVEVLEGATAIEELRIKYPKAK